MGVQPNKHTDADYNMKRDRHATYLPLQKKIKLPHWASTTLACIHYQWEKAFVLNLKWRTAAQFVCFLQSPLNQGHRPSRQYFPRNVLSLHMSLVTEFALFSLKNTNLTSLRILFYNFDLSSVDARNETKEMVKRIMVQRAAIADSLSCTEWHNMTLCTINFCITSFSTFHLRTAHFSIPFHHSCPCSRPANDTKT